MQQNGQEPQEPEYLQRIDRRPEQEDISIQAEEPPTSEQQKTEEYLDLLRRTQADFVNYRRRMSKEQAEGRIAAQSELLAQLFPVLDDLGRALSAAPAELNMHPWVQGLFLVARRLTMQLDQLGVRQIGAPGEPFDPRWHEAITTEVRADAPEGTILHVIQPGYALGERIIRPARVSVVASSTHA